jgi:hypothetical protein
MNSRICRLAETGFAILGAATLAAAVFAVSATG